MGRLHCGWSSWRRIDWPDGLQYSYNFYQKDVEALKQLGVKSFFINFLDALIHFLWPSGDPYPFSLSWARILPNDIGRVNQAGGQYYKNRITALKAANIEPIVAFYHWDLPYALEREGGWLNSKVADWFEEYARVCFTELGNVVIII